jgi:hypothetical protein
MGMDQGMEKMLLLWVASFKVKQNVTSATVLNFITRTQNMLRLRLRRTPLSRRPLAWR